MFSPKPPPLLHYNANIKQLNPLSKYNPSRVHDREETGQIPLSDFRNIMSEYGLRVPEDQGDHCVDYLEYLRAVSEL